MFIHWVEYLAVSASSTRARCGGAVRGGRGRAVGAARRDGGVQIRLPLLTTGQNNYFVIIF